MKQIFASFAVLLLIVSCGEGQSEQVENEPTPTEDSLVQEEVVEDPLEGLTLKEDGGKWEVNPETQVGMERVDSILQAFSGDDFVQLGTEVKEELSTIISLCTMKGEDHDQYHIVLHACMKESKAMKRGEVETTENLERFVSTYYDYFQVWEEAPVVED